MRYDTMKDNSLDAMVLTTGTVVAYDPVAKTVTLANGTTYVFPLGHERSAIANETALAGVHIKWSSAVVAVITVETCNFPVTLSGNGGGGADVASFDSVAGNWIQENPSTAYVAVSPAGAATVTNLTVTIPGGTAGGCTIHLGNLGTRRCRIKAVVTTGGAMRIAPHGKLGA